MHIENKSNSRKINFLITGFILLLIGGIVFTFIRHRLILKNIDPPPPPETTEANLTIKKFQHVSTEDGVKQWALEAVSASLYSKDNTVRLKDISVIFFRQDSSNVTLTANEGEFNSTTKNMILTGNIVAVMAPYRITTENLNYDHQLRIISADKPVKITGTAVFLHADSMTYGIETTTIQCQGNVKGSFIETTQ